MRQLCRPIYWPALQPTTAHSKDSPLQPMTAHSNDSLRQPTLATLPPWRQIRSWIRRILSIQPGTEQARLPEMSSNNNWVIRSLVRRHPSLFYSNKTLEATTPSENGVIKNFYNFISIVKSFPLCSVKLMVWSEHKKFGFNLQIKASVEACLVVGCEGLRFCHAHYLHMQGFSTLALLLWNLFCPKLHNFVLFLGKTAMDPF